jgi:hypothetical protein
MQCTCCYRISSNILSAGFTCWDCIQNFNGLFYYIDTFIEARCAKGHKFAHCHFDSVILNKTVRKTVKENYANHQLSAKQESSANNLMFI